VCRDGEGIGPAVVGADYSSVLFSGMHAVLVEGAAEPVPSADIQLRDTPSIGNRSGLAAQGGCGSSEGSGGAGSLGSRPGYVHVTAKILALASIDMSVLRG
jgi:hypothetical protein